MYVGIFFYGSNSGHHKSINGAARVSRGAPNVNAVGAVRNLPVRFQQCATINLQMAMNWDSNEQILTCELTIGDQKQNDTLCCLPYR